MTDDFEARLKRWKQRQETTAENTDADARWRRLNEKLNPKPPEVVETQDYKRRVCASFVEDLNRGKKGEQSFYDKYAHCLTPLNSRGADFELNKSGELLELKTDYYQHDLYNNFIFEIGSDTGTPGGAQKALNDGCSYLAYYFINDEILYVFNVRQLLKFLDKNKDKYKIHTRLNRGYSTLYQKIPRDDVKHLYLEPEDIHLYEKKRRKK